jgi:hypothetical protein
MRLSRKIMYLETMQQNSSGLRGIALKSLTGLALGLGLWACSSTDMAGGGPSGTEAGNAIMAKLYNEDGSKATYATVTLIKKTSLSGEANAYTVQADSNGLVVIDSVDVGDYIMEGSLEGNNVQIDVTVANDKDSIQLGEHKLQKPVYISGSLVEYGCKDCDSAFGTLKFFGLNHSTIVTNGMFSIGGLPAGNLNFAFIPNMGAKLDTIVLPTIKAKAGDSIVVEHVAPPPPEPEDTTKKDTVPKPERKLETLLLENFTDGDEFHNMGAPYTRERGTAIGTWMLIVGDYGAISIEPKASNSGYPFIDVIETDDDENKLVHFKVTFPDSDYQAYPPPFYNETVLQTTMDSLTRAKDSINWVSKWWTTCTMQIGKSGLGYNFSLVDSIAFEAWGTGSFTFEFLSGSSNMAPMYLYMYTDPRNSIIAAKDFDLSQKKNRIAVAVADLIPDEEQRKNISMIAWTFHDNAEFSLDNVELIGHDLESIWTKE